MFRLWSLCLVIFISSCRILDVSHTENNAPDEMLVTSQNFSYLPLLAKDKTTDGNEIKDIHYDLVIHLNKQRNQFEIDAEINFTLANNADAIFLNFIDFDIKKAAINQKPIYLDYNGRQIKLDASLLKKGKNTLNILYQGKYQSAGNGLNAWKDPQDSQTYLYSQLKKQGAETLIPTFDKSHLLAKFNLLVFAPKGWHVISTAPETKVPKILSAAKRGYDDTSGTELWRFSETPPISPQHFSLFAGPFKFIESVNDKAELRLFAPTSILEKHNNEVKMIRWLNVTNQSLSRLQQFLQVDYPYKKYDQIWLPTLLQEYDDATATVMLTNKELSTSDKQLPLQKTAITETLAKQWFGHYVTASKWQNMWLHESLSKFITNLTELESNKTSRIWLDFYADEKYKAYHHDNLKADNLDQPLSDKQLNVKLEQQIANIKGTALLRQLHFALGEPSFRLALKKYLNDFNFSHTKPEQFFLVLEQYQLESFSQWQNEWIQNPGINQIQTRLECKNGRIKALKLIQQPDNAGILRKQKVNLAFFNINKQGLDLKSTLPITYQGKETPVDAAIDVICPDFIFANYQDLGYLNINFTSADISKSSHYFNNISDPLLSLMIWQSLWQSVLNNTLTTDEYLALVLINLPKEKSLIINQQIAQNILQLTKFILNMPITKKSYSQQVTTMLIEQSINKIINSKEYPDLQQVWLNTYIELAQNTSHLNHLYSLLGEKKDPRFPSLSQTQRWNIIKQLNRHNYPNSISLIRKESKKDTSMEGKIAKLLAYIIEPVSSEKRLGLKSLNRLPYKIQQQVMENIYPIEQGMLRLETIDERLAFLTNADSNTDRKYLVNYSKYLTPNFCIEELREKLTIILNKDLPPEVRQNIQKIKLEIKQCMNIKKQIKNSS